MTHDIVCSPHDRAAEAKKGGDDVVDAGRQAKCDTELSAVADLAQQSGVHGENGCARLFDASDFFVFKPLLIARRRMWLVSYA